MKLPALCGHLERRILLNYRVDPKVLAPLLPVGLRPFTWRGEGVAGICLLRLSQVRPEGLPAWMGLSSESAAHRIAVAWEEEGHTRTGVYVLRRDTSAWLPHLLGSRVFPGRFERSHLQVETSPEGWSLQLEGKDLRVALRVRKASERRGTSLFRDLDEASAFFQSGALGWSQGDPHLEGMMIALEGWNLRPLDIEYATSSYFEDRARFPEGSLHLDSAYCMEHLPLRWVNAGHKDIRCA